MNILIIYVEFSRMFLLLLLIFLMVLEIDSFKGAMSSPAWENMEECMATISAVGIVEFAAVSLILFQASCTRQNLASGTWLWVPSSPITSGLVSLSVVWRRAGHPCWRWWVHRHIFLWAPSLLKLNRYPPLVIMGRFLDDVKVTTGSDAKFCNIHLKSKTSWVRTNQIHVIMLDFFPLK